MRIELVKIKGTFNVADLFTKHVDRATMEKMAEALGAVYLEGRHDIAPEVNAVHEAIVAEQVENEFILSDAERKSLSDIKDNLILSTSFSPEEKVQEIKDQTPCSKEKDLV